MKSFLIIILLSTSPVQIFAQRKYCADSSIRLKYQFNFNNGSFVSKTDTSGKNYFLGQANTNPASGICMKTTWGDSIIWAKKFFNPAFSIGFANGTFTSDGGIIINGFYRNSDILLCKIDTNSNFIWANRYSFSRSNIGINSGRSDYKNTIVGSDGIYLVADISSNDYRCAVIKLDFNGNLIWSRAVRKNFFTGFDYDYNGITISHDTVFVAFDVTEQSLTSGLVVRRYPIITQLNTINGTTISNTAIKTNPDPVVKGLVIQNLKNLSDSALTISGQIAVQVNGNLNNRSLIPFSLVADKNFLLKSGYWYNPTPYYMRAYDVSEGSSKAYIFEAGNLNTRHFTIIDKDNAIYRNRLFTMPLALPNGNKVVVNHDFKQNLHVLFNYPQNGAATIEYIRLSDLAKANTPDCFGNDSAFLNISPVGIYTEPFNWDIEESNVLIQSPVNLFVENQLVSKLVVCKEVSYCDSIKIRGSPLACFPGPEGRYNRYLNPQCLKKVNWQPDTAYATIISNEADTAIVLRFKRNGQFWLKAMVNNCVIADSLLITVYSPQTSLQLNKGQTAFCPGDSITLQVNPFFRNYLWQDGSTLNTFIVKNSGLYWIRGTDSCGNILSDTISMNVVDTNLSLLPNYKICPYDTAQIFLPVDLNNVSWQPSAFGSLIANRLIFYPSQTTNYSITAQRQPGCNIQKTVAIALNNCPEWVRFPSGFTPNRDGLNDQFKPGTSGHLVSYSLKVFDRGGQIIFSTNNPIKGWDGTYNGSPQNGGVFVYMASYKFMGAEEKHAKGTLVLIR